MPMSVYTVLNAQNNYKETIALTAPIQERFARFMANRELLISASFLADGYTYDVAAQRIEPKKGLALSGSKLAYAVKDDLIYKATIEVVNKTGLTDDLQLIIYFFS